MKKGRKIKGKIELKPIEFSEIHEFEVKKANKSSGRIYLPSRFIGKRVYVLIKGEDDEQ
jgi:putative transposon-encoded protein